MSYARFYNQAFHDRKLNDSPEYEKMLREDDELDYMVPSDVYIVSTRYGIECWHTGLDTFFGWSDICFKYDTYTHAEACRLLLEYLEAGMELGLNVPWYTLKRLREESDPEWDGG